MSRLFQSAIRLPRSLHWGFLGAAVLILATCDVLTEPGGVPPAQLRYMGDTAFVVGDVIEPPVSVTQNGSTLNTARVLFSSSNPNVIAITPSGNQIDVRQRGTVMLRVQLVSSALGGNPPSDSVRVRAIASSVRADLDGLALNSLGDSVVLVARAHNRADQPIPAPELRWVSTNPAVASIDAVTGRIKALSNGQTLAIAEVDGKRDTVPVSVRQVLAHYTFQPASVVFNSLSDTVTVVATPRDSGGTVLAPAVAPSFTFESKFPGISSVSTGGRVTAIANGENYIRARSGVGSAAVVDSVRVEVRQVAQQVVITGSDSVLIEAIGDTTQLIALASDRLSGSILNANPVWASLDLSLAIVDPFSGVVRALAVGGPARIVARLDDVADTVRVYVSNLPRVLEVTPGTVQITAVGDATQLTATPKNRLGAVLADIGVTWGTSLPGVATVDATGLVTATGVGTARVFATALGGVLGDTTEVNVVDSPDAVDITSGDTTLTSFDDTFSPGAVIQNSRGAPLARSAVTWVSDDAGIATVSPLGLVRAISAGTVKIRATNPLNAARTDSVTVTVANIPTSISLNRSLDTLTAPSKTLLYAADSRNARGVQIAATAISWSSSNPAVASVDAAGLATALTPGTTTITAQTAGASGPISSSATLVVRNAPKTLSISPTAATLTFVGATQQITPTVLNDLGNAAVGTVLWSSSNPSVASVSGGGLVTAQAVGTTIITARVGNLNDTLSAIAAIEVTDAPASINITQTSVTLASINDSFPTTGTYTSGLGAALPSTAASWTSDDPTVAEVTSAGIIIALSRGATKVRATSPLNASVRDSVSVTVTNAPVSLALNRTSDNLSSLGRTLGYTATVLNARGATIPTEPVAWTSTASGIASVAAGNSQTNTATALSVGSTSIIASAGTGPGLVADTATLVVANTAVSVAITPAPANISAVGGQLVLTATARNELGNVIPGAAATWGTANGAIASVTSPGATTTVTGTGVGSVLVTATVDGATAQLTVSVANDLVVVDIVTGNTTLASVNDTLIPTVDFRNGTGTSLASDVAVWSSTDDNVATVSSNGTIVARGAGSAVIRAESPLNAGIFDQITITVTNAPASVDLNRNDTTLTAIGRTLNIGASVFNARGGLIGDPSVTWFSRTPGVATISSQGFLTATGVGTSRVGAMSGTAGDSIVVTVTNNAASVTASPAAVTITSLAATASITPTVRNDLGNAITGATVTWGTSDASIVTVPAGSTAGAQNVTAAGVGTATVTLTAGAGITTTIPVTVRDDPTSVTITPAAVTLLNLWRSDTPAVDFRNAQNIALGRSSVVWSTTDPSVATVSSSGVVTGTGAGTAKIAATSPSDPTRTDTVTYTVQAPAYSVTLDYATDSLTALTRSRVYTATVRDSVGNVLPGVGASVAWTASNNAGPKVTFTPTSGFSTTATAAAVSGATPATLTATVTPITALTGASLAASVNVGVGNDPASVAAAPTAVTITSVGGTASITPTVRNNLGLTIAGASVTWATSDAGVVTVPAGSTSGAQNVTAAGAGSATVTITAATGVSTTVAVTVRNDPATIDFGTTTAVTLLNVMRTDDLFANAQTTIENAQGDPLGAGSVVWTTTNASVATVSASGVVTGVGAGTAKIAAVSPVDPGVTDTVTYTIQAPAYSISLDYASDSLTALTQSRVYTATVRDSLGNVLPGVGGSVAWTTTSNAGPKITPTSAASGLTFTATAAAVSAATRATLTATVTPATSLTGASLTASVTIGVGNDPASVAAAPTAVTITSVGGTASITPTVRNNLGLTISGASVTWGTSNALVVTTPGGSTTGAQNITATGVGTATVTITAATGVTTTVAVVVRNDPVTIDFGTTTAVTLLNVQRTDDLFANAQTTIQNAQAVDLPASSATWTSTNPSVATVSAAGVVTGIGAGTAKIAATSPFDPGVTDTVTYTVQAPAYTVTLDYAIDSLTALTQSRVYTATVRDSLGNVLPGVGGSVAWTTTNNAGPKITPTSAASGLTFTATAAAVSGATRATLTATVTPATVLAGASLAASVDIGVGNEPASVVAAPSAAVIGSVGGTASITPTVRNSLGSPIAGATVSWSTSNAGVVTVPGGSTTGAQNITGAGVGTATVTITAAAGVTTTVPVTVTNHPATVDVTSADTTLTSVGHSYTPGFDFRNAAGGSLAIESATWSSSNSSVATVSTAGLVTAVSVGTARIRAISPGDAAIGDSITVTVTNTASAATSLISASPGSIVANGTSTATVQVRLKNAAGLNVTVGGDAVTLSTTRGSLGAVTDNGDGTYSATLTSGTSAGNATITGTVNTVAITDNAVVTFVAGPPTQLAFQLQPPTPLEANQGFSTVVEVRDAFGNPVTTDPSGSTTEEISLDFTAGTNTEGATLSGTVTGVDVDWSTGRATFTGISVNLPGSYQLDAASAGFTVTAATSTAFTVVATLATILSTTPDPLTEAGLDGAVVEIELSGGNFVSTPDTSDFNLATRPAGTEIVLVSRTDAHHVFLTLDFDGTDFDAAQTISVQVESGALSTGIATTTGTAPVTPRPATDVEISGSGSIAANTWTAYTLTAIEAPGNAMTVTADADFDLTTTSAGTFSLSATGTPTTTTMTIGNGTSAATFYYNDVTPGTPTITADWTSGGPDLGSDDHGITVNATTATISATTPDPLLESTLDGAILEITLVNGTFVGAPAVGDFTLNGAPTGLTILGVTFVSATVVELELDFDGTNFAGQQDISVSVGAGALETGIPATSGVASIADDVP